jgi:iron complex transport system substrate-binding protein
LLSVATEKSRFDKLTNDIIIYVKKHYTEKINFQEFAHTVNISQSSLFRKFKKEFDITPANYINKFRIYHASVLLENNDDLSIQEIAAAVGFPDVFYFSKIFKKYLNLSPSAYRNVIKENRGNKNP